jgi:Fe-S cluster biogenesis protein NfuA|tara:strand:- start:37300 stop:37878 length:579 start_codon:yes stop_codon:yes gene_type:complete
MISKTPFVIYSESTPNPSVMKFVANKNLTNNSKEARNIEETKGWPLLESIFSLPFVKEIFISNNYISIKKHDTVEWMEITNHIRIFIQEKLNNNTQVCKERYINTVKSNTKKNKSNFYIEVENIINTSIKANIQMDGGDIELISCDDGIIKVFLKGACSGCPSSQITLKNGIETLLKDTFPDKIKEVVAINS